MLQGKGRMEIRGFDWGPSVCGIIIGLSEKADINQTLTSDMFAVKEKRKEALFPKTTDRIVKDAYFCDANGNKKDLQETENSFIMLELETETIKGVFMDFFKGFPMYMEKGIPLNKWSKSFVYTVKMKDGTKIRLSDGTMEKLDEVSVSLEECKNPETVFLPEIENVSTDNTFTGSKGHTFCYASYEPKEADEKNLRPLVIWIHGLGEGGNDPKICVYGNKVVSLFGDKFQEIMGGAYVLVPQSPTYWMQYKENTGWKIDNSGQDSLYLEELKELIDKYAESKFIDKDRILVGGCSNGGYMTMDLIMNYPGFFAAAYPICEAFKAEAVTEEKIQNIKDLPIWFVYAKNDEAVSPAEYEEPVINRLKEAGSDVITSVYDDVHDLTGQYFIDGKPFKYFGHWSWIYFFNNDCVENGVSIWEWMSKQKRN